MKYGATTSVVEETSRLQLVGPLLDRAWFGAHILRFPNGKPNMNAIIILGDIVSWYRAAHDVDEASGKVIRRRRFADTKLSIHLESYGERFGLSREQTKDALKFLKDAGLITKEQKAALVDGVPHPNTIYVEPVVEVLREISLKAVSPDNQWMEPLRGSVDGTTDITNVPVTNNKIPSESVTAPPKAKERKSRSKLYPIGGPNDEWGDRRARFVALIKEKYPLRNGLGATEEHILRVSRRYRTPEDAVPFAKAVRNLATAI